LLIQIILRVNIPGAAFSTNPVRWAGGREELTTPETDPILKIMFRLCGLALLDFDLALAQPTICLQAVFSGLFVVEGFPGLRLTTGWTAPGGE